MTKHSDANRHKLRDIGEPIGSDEQKNFYGRGIEANNAFAARMLELGYKPVVKTTPQGEGPRRMEATSGSAGLRSSADFT